LAGLILGSFNEAEDVTHDAYVRAWNRIDTLRDPAQFQPWFDRILVNLCRDRMRRSRIVRIVPVDDAAGRAITDPYDELLGRHELLSALDALDVDLRTVVVLRYWADLAVDDIAARLDVPSGTVKSRLHRAVRRMRSAMADSGEVEATT
jgi:RNA polymerase sigma-70 factor, ECF subfamily